MTRIIAGTVGGRRLRTHKGPTTRPTSDRVREALFSRLASKDLITGAHVLDAYAGSGALGLEALSRGAATVLLIEADKGTAATLRKNVTELGLSGADIRVTTVAAALAAPATRSFDLVLADPPYPMSEDALARDLALLPEQGWLGAGAVVVVERSVRSPEPAWPDGLRGDAMRRYGETALWFARGC